MGYIGLSYVINSLICPIGSNKELTGYKELGKIDKDVYRISEPKIGSASRRRARAVGQADDRGVMLHLARATRKWQRRLSIGAFGISMFRSWMESDLCGA